MLDRPFQARLVSLSERVDFHCKRCGNCCRHLLETVPLNTLDAFRLAKHLRSRGEQINTLDDVYTRYADIVPLHECGYSVYMLKTTGPDDACIFLKDNRCTIHPAKPHACRLYPFALEPKGNGKYDYLLALEQAHHFKGGQVQVKRWMKKAFAKADKEFYDVDFGSTPEIARLLNKTPPEKQKQALVLFLWYKYGDIDLDKPFMEQYRRNIVKLLAALKQMINSK